MEAVPYGQSDLTPTAKRKKEKNCFRPSFSIFSFFHFYFLLFRFYFLLSFNNSFLFKRLLGAFPLALPA